MMSAFGARVPVCAQWVANQTDELAAGTVATIPANDRSFGTGDSVATFRDGQHMQTVVSQGPVATYRVAPPLSDQVRDTDLETSHVPLSEDPVDVRGGPRHRILAQGWQMPCDAVAMLSACCDDGAHAAHGADALLHGICCCSER